MPKPLVTKWLEATPLTEEAIRTKYVPAGHYRITANRYPPGIETSGASRASTIYITSGECQLQNLHGHVTLVAGDIFESPEGTFHLKVSQSEELRMVTVWELPPQFWR